MAEFGPHIVPVAGGTAGGGSFSAGVSTGGNTSGSTGTVSNQIVFAGGNNITLSQSTGVGGATVTISGANAGGAQTGISSIGNSQVTYTSGAIQLLGSNQITVKSTTGQGFVIDMTLPAETQTFVSGVANSETTYTSGVVKLSGLGNVTVRSTTGQQFQISVPAQSVQAETQTFIGGLVGSNATYTSGTVTFTGVGGGVTVNSNTGQRIDISVAAPVAQTNQSAIKALGVSNTGTTAGNTGVSTGVDWVIAASGNITASQSTAVGGPNTVWMSVPSPAAQTNQTGNVYASNNTFGTSSGTYDARTITIAGDGIISVAASNSGWRISASQSNQTGNQYAIGNTYGTSSGTRDDRTLSIAGDGIISVAASNSGFRISASQSNQSAIKAFGASNTGNTAGNTGVSTGIDWVLAGTNNITISESTAGGGPNTLWVSGGAGGAGMSAGLSNVGNTSGDTATVTGRLVLAGGNNITLSGSTNAGSMTITVSAPNLGAGAMSAGVSNLGNTAGSTGITGTQLVLVGTNMVSLSQSTGANGATVSINATQSSQSAIEGLGVSNTGNTLGNTRITTGIDMVIAGSGALTASQSTGAGADTIWLSAPATSSLVGSSGLSISSNGSTITVYQAADPVYMHNSAALYNYSSSAIANSSVTVVRMDIPDVVSFTRVDIPMSLALASSAASHTAAHSISKVMILGTRNGSTINAITGVSQTEVFSWASNTSNWANLTGLRLMSFPLATYMTPGEYYVYYYLSTTAFSSVGAANTTNLGGTYNILFGSISNTGTVFAQLGSATAQTSNPLFFMQGAQSISLSATNQTVQASNITQSGTAGIRANQIVFFRNV